MNVWNDGSALGMGFDFEPGPDPREAAKHVRCGGMALDPDDYFNPYPRALPRGTPKICSFFNTFVT